MALRFSWTTFDVTHDLPAGWQDDVAALADEADFREFPLTPVLSREAMDVAGVPRGRVHADQVQRSLPWLREFYRGDFLQLAQEVCTERVAAAADNRYGVVLNVQRGNAMRFECHVDSNPLTGLLFCTDQRPAPVASSSSGTTRPPPTSARWSGTARSSARRRAT